MKRPPEKLRGLVRFSSETLSALGLALVFIVYVVQAFRIPSGSMEDSLLTGDWLLGAKFMYGSPVLPFSDMKFPGIRNPEAGDVVIFKAPTNGGREYIKRCVAGPGQTVEINGTKLYVDKTEVAVPPGGKHIAAGETQPPCIRRFGPIRVPARGDRMCARNLSLRDILFLKHCMRQENPREKTALHAHLYIDGKQANDVFIEALDRSGNTAVITLDRLNAMSVFDKPDTWVELEAVFRETERIVSAAFPNRTAELHPVVLRNNVPVDTYTVKNDNYFMLGDNRDNSLDSRFWGFVNRRSVHAQAIIIYFSFDSGAPWWNITRCVRWDRLGKLIRSWDGQA